MSFADDLERERREQTPKIALRRFPGDLLDDVVVENVQMFRAEFMDDDVLWMCCYFHNGERITFDAITSRPANRRQSIELREGEMPAEWIDWDNPQGGVIRSGAA